MSYIVNGHNVFLILLTTLISSLILVPIVKKVAHHIGAIDYPNERKVHKKPIPRLGGLAIFLSFLIGYMCFGQVTTQMISILIGSFIIIVLGICDDIKPVPARYKFLVQTIAACIVVFYGHIYIDMVSIFGLEIVFGAWGYPLAVLLIVSIINAVNLIDGLDVILCVIMLGSTLGFLAYNFNPASIFMGDTGSMFLGFMISVTALLGYKGATVTSLIIPILILFLPILDTILAIFRRLLKGENIGAPDKEHLHHQLLKLNKSTKKTVLIMYAFNLLCALISILYALGDNKLAIILYSILLIITLILIFKTDILFKHNKKDK